MSTNKCFLSAELEAALDKIEISRNEQVNVDVVYIPSEVDALTDEEDFDDNILLENNNGNHEVMETYELQVDKCGEKNEEPVAAKKLYIQLLTIFLNGQLIIIK
ncbi:hypothetical protein FQA39_LY14985 [Lamprigera yunnana]|nr:hypothetical protein FQA39_LY14985 [Lamprigera yunnana]